VGLHETQSGGGAVVHDVDEEAGDVQVLEELLHGVGQVVECVVEGGCGRGLGVAEPRQVGGNDVHLRSQERDQAPEHVGRCGETMEQQHGGLARIAGLSVEHFELRELGMAVLHFVHRSQRNRSKHSVSHEFKPFTNSSSTECTSAVL
jgi:hypothetical protein